MSISTDLMKHQRIQKYIDSITQRMILPALLTLLLLLLTGLQPALARGSAGTIVADNGWNDARDLDFQRGTDQARDGALNSPMGDGSLSDDAYPLFPDHSQDAINTSIRPEVRINYMGSTQDEWENDVVLPVSNEFDRQVDFDINDEELGMDTSRGENDGPLGYALGNTFGSSHSYPRIDFLRPGKSNENLVVHTETGKLLNKEELEQLTKQYLGQYITLPPADASKQTPADITGKKPQQQ